MADAKKTEDKKLFTLTEEHKAQIYGWHKKWVDIALRTTPQTANERDLMVKAIKGLYVAADLAAPKDVVFGASPLSCQIASGITYYAQENKKSVNLNIMTTNPVLKEVVNILGSLFDTKGNSKKAVVVDDGAKNFVRQFAQAVFPDFSKTDINAVCEEVKLAINTYSGGNMWAAGVDFISFFRHVVKLDIDYSKWQFYEDASIYGGFRFMYPDFCIVSDFPTKISLDAGNQAHSPDGPSHKWADGFEIFNWHGYLIPATHQWIVTDKARIRPDDIEKEPNAELRRIMLEIYGFDRYINDRNAVVLSEDVDGNGHPRRLLEMVVAGEKVRIMEVNNGSLEADGSRRKFHIGAMPGSTPHEAVAASYGINPKVYKEAVRT